MSAFEKMLIQDKIDGASTWHILHIFLTLLTGLFWLPVWIVCTVLNQKKRKKYTRHLRALNEEN